jgi:hypothetical protein
LIEEPARVCCCCWSCVRKLLLLRAAKDEALNLLENILEIGGSAAVAKEFVVLELRKRKTCMNGRYTQKWTVGKAEGMIENAM